MNTTLQTLGSDEAAQMKALLVGRTVTDVFRLGDHFGFDTESGGFAFRTVGECCSRSWVEGIDVLARLPAIVTDVESRWNRDHGRFVKISTARGHIDIDGRNDGGESGCYSFRFEVVATDGLVAVLAPLQEARLAEAMRTNDWKNYQEISYGKWAPGFRIDGGGTRFSEWRVVK